MQTGPTAEPTDNGTAAKRRRASQLGLLGENATTPNRQQSTTPNTTASPHTNQQDEPDVFEFFAQRNEGRQDLELKLRTLQQQQAHFQTRVTEAEAAASRLRAELASWTAQAQTREAQFQSQRQQLERELEKEVKKVTALEIQLRELADNQSETLLLSLPSPETTVSASRDVHNLKGRISQLELELIQARSDREESHRQDKASIEAERQRANAQLHTIELLQRQLDETSAQADSHAASKRQHESRAAELERELQSSLLVKAPVDHSEGNEVLIRTLREKLEKQEPLVQEVLKLREQAFNIHILKEQVQSAQARARIAEESLERASIAEGRAEEAEQQLCRWTAILSDAAGCATPEDILHLLTKLQQERVLAESRVSDRADEVAALKADLSATEAKVIEADAARSSALAAAETQALDLEKSERKAALYAKERDGLRAILASYDEEYLNHQGTAALTPPQKRIIELEATIEELHSYIKILESSADADRLSMGGKKRASLDGQAAIAAAESRATAAEARARELEGEALSLQQQVAALEKRVSAGDFNPLNTRVVHFKDNPEAIFERESTKALIAQLESENEALKTTVLQFEHAPTDLAVSGSLKVAQLEGENSLLSKRLAEVQKTSERLQQIFTRQIAIFREAVLLLFGYRVEMISDPSQRDCRAQFTLTPAGQEHNHHSSLAFKLMRDGCMVLQPTTATIKQYTREIETFIERFKSIPAFIANLTMENFQKDTKDV